MSLPLRLFEGVGVELEYMIVERDSLRVLPICDRLMAAVAGADASDHEDGAIAWSNELVLHVLEFKTNGPAPALAGLAAEFQRSIRRANELLRTWSATLLPGGVHPTMDPVREMQLWPHESGPIYQAYDRIFGCRGHGWANLQSCHLNLPFRGDQEFAALHSAVRAVLPVLPALAAASPLLEGRLTGFRDSRLEVYRLNQRKIPTLTGAVVPEPVGSISEYHDRILGRIYADIAAEDPEGVLRHEWLNSRGAIARFDRDAIEIRVLDTQEAPAADLAILNLVTATVRALVEERWGARRRLDALDTAHLAVLLQACIRDAEDAVLEAPEYLGVFGLAVPRLRAGDLWKHLAGTLPREPAPELDAPLATILQRGTLATRLGRALGPSPTPAGIAATYQELRRCLQEGTSFVP